MEPPTELGSDAKDSLHRSLGLVGILTLSIGAMIGSGIFVLPSLAFKITGDSILDGLKPVGDPADYEREIRHLVQMVGTSPADDSASPVRMPGRNAWFNRAKQMTDGVALDPGVLDLLSPYADAAGLGMPARTTMHS